MKIRHLLALFSLGIWFACSTEKDYLITIETRHGNMHAILFDETPEHKKNFVRLVEEGRFDSTEFHRIISGFMIQGGDVFTKEGIPPEEWYTLPAEFNEALIHEKGNIAAARQGDGINPQKRSSGSQFYVVQGKTYDKLELETDMAKLQETFMKFLQLGSNKPLMDRYTEIYRQGDYEQLTSLMLDSKEQMESFFNINLSKKLRDNQLEAYTTIGGTPHLDDEYTVFGKVIDGIEVIDKIAEEKTGSQDKPLEQVYMKVKVERITKKEISELYDYVYPQEND